MSVTTISLGKVVDVVRLQVFVALRHGKSRWGCETTGRGWRDSIWRLRCGGPGRVWIEGVSIRDIGF